MEACQDTLDRSAKARSKQGTYELEFSFGGEMDLHKHFHCCYKNPGHTNFIPINKLEYDHLPEVIRSIETLDWIKHIAQLTVKLTVNYISPHRKHPLPLSKYAGKKIMHVGCGSMSEIRLKEDRHDLPCPFDNCPDLSEQHQVYCYIVITTAAHVVFDDDEAKNTTVEFFYDNCEDRSNVRTARGVKVGTVSVEGDFCELLCATHDKDMFNRLEHMPSYKGLFFYGVSELKTEVRTYCPIIGRIISGLFGRFPCLKDIYIDIGYCSLDFRVDVIVNNDTNSAELLALLVKCDIIKLLFDSNNLSTLYCFLYKRNISFQRYDSQYIIITCGDYTRKEKICDETIEDKSLFNSVQVENAILIHKLDELLRENPSNVDSIFTLMVRSIHRKSPVIKIFEHFGNTDLWLSMSFPLNDQYKYALHENLSSSFVTDYNRKMNKKEKLLIECEEDQRRHEHVMIHISHGQSKNITFGTLADCLTGDGHYMPLYTNPTCSGCSGGAVSVMSETKKVSDVYEVPQSEVCSILECEEEQRNENVMIHISHPHGQSKHITFGTLIDCLTGDGHYTPRYTVPTCPGCSGGPVWVIPKTKKVSDVYGVPHSGCYDTHLKHGCSWTIYP